MTIVDEGEAVDDAELIPRLCCSCCTIMSRRSRSISAEVMHNSACALARDNRWRFWKVGVIYGGGQEDSDRAVSVEAEPEDKEVMS